MNKPYLLNQYIKNYTVSEKWKLTAGNTENISQVIVIPAYAESSMLFSTLASLARNSSSSLDYSLVLCVINNKINSPADVKVNNHQTMEYLDVLVNKKSAKQLPGNKNLKEALQFIADARLKLGYIDASSEGLEIPDNEGGVGMARKIGMDTALRLLFPSASHPKLILSLDADTLVPDNYLTAIHDCFQGKINAAVVAYEHQEPENDEEKAAIYCYEIFLRYWILGLKYAKSPYAFHSIGSTMICSAEAYLSVRGMNRREAGEDFYFLNKLAKITKIKYIKNTCVYPSSRASQRVPFGTGKRIHRFLDGSRNEYVLYNPQIFEILARWLKLMEMSLHYNEENILREAGRISPALVSFLINSRFEESWRKIRNNAKNDHTLINQFHCWFDGFRTLKLINYLSRESYPQKYMFDALENLLKMQKLSVPEFLRSGSQPDLARQKNILQYLRGIT